MGGQLLGYVRRLLSQPAAGALGDAVLLERFVQGHDSGAFGSLVQRHQSMVTGTCLRLLGNVHDAEDVAQATFLVLARKAASIRPPESLAAWLHGVARNLALKLRRGECRRSGRETRAARRDLSAGHSDPLDELSASELLAIIDEELRHLPEVYRLPLILCYLEGRSQDEIARHLGWTPGSVKGRLERGRARLRVRLARRGLAGLLVLETLRSPATASLPVTCLAQAALAVANGQRPSNPGVTAKVALLTEQALRSLTAAKIKSALLLLLVVGVASTGLGALVQQGWSGRVGEVTPEAGTNPATEAKEAPPIPRTTDRFGDPLPPGALARFGSVRFRQATWISAAAVTTDGKHLATTGDGITLWDAGSGKELRRFHGEQVARDGQRFQHGYTAVAFSRDGKYLAAGSHVYGPDIESPIWIWELATGKEVARLSTHKQGVGSIIFLPGGNTLVSRDRYGESVVLWDLKTAKEIHRWPAGGGSFHCVACSADGKLLATGGAQGPDPFKSPGGIRLLEVSTGKERRLPGHKQVVMRVAFAPDGETLASGTWGGTIRLWNLASGKEAHRFQAHQEGITALAFSADGATLVSSGQDRTIGVWEATGKLKYRIALTASSAGFLAFSGPQTFVSSSLQNTVHFWSTATGKEVGRFPGHERNLIAVGFMNDKKTVATVGHFSIRLWNAATQEEIGALPITEGSVAAAVFPDSGKALAAEALTDAVQVWDVQNKKLVGRVPFPGLRTDATWQSQVALSPDGKVLAVRGKRDQIVRILDTSTLKRLASFQVSGKEAQNAPLAFSPDNGTLAVVHNRQAASGYSVHLHDVASGKESRRWQADGRMVNSFAFSPDSRTLVAGENVRFLRLWETATGQQRKVIEHGGMADAVAWSPDGKTLACVRNFTLLLVHAGTGKELARFLLFNGSTSYRGVGPNALTFSRDGRLLAAATFQTTALLWDLGGVRSDQSVSAAPLPAGVPEELWNDLASSDASRAYEAIWNLAAHPAAAIGVLKEHLRPVAPLTPAEVEQFGRLLADLDSDRFAVRKKAMQDLERLGARAEAGLQRITAAKRTQLETRSRAERLLTKLQQNHLRELRAIEVLEHIGNAEALQILRRLANGTPQAWLTREVRSTLERLARR